MDTSSYCDITDYGEEEVVLSSEEDQFGIAIKTNQFLLLMNKNGTWKSDVKTAGNLPVLQEDDPYVECDNLAEHCSELYESLKHKNPDHGDYYYDNIDADKFEGGTYADGEMPKRGHWVASDPNDFINVDVPIAKDTIIDYIRGECIYNGGSYSGFELRTVCCRTTVMIVPKTMDAAGIAELHELHTAIFEKHGVNLEIGLCRKLCSCT